jgi:hypothetical protein
MLFVHTDINFTPTTKWLYASNRESAEISTLTKHTVVCDFRVQDVKLVTRRSISPNW